MGSKIGKSFLECSFISLMTYLASLKSWNESVWAAGFNPQISSSPFKKHFPLSLHVCLLHFFSPCINFPDLAFREAVDESDHSACLSANQGHPVPSYLHSHKVTMVGRGWCPPHPESGPAWPQHVPLHESQSSSLDSTSFLFPLLSSCFQKQSDKLICVEKFNVWFFQGELVSTENQGSEQKLQQGLKFNLLYSELWKTKGSFLISRKDLILLH